MSFRCLVVDDNHDFLQAACKVLESGGITVVAGPPRAVILISTHGEEDFSDLIAASPAIGFLPKWKLSARAIENLLRERGDGLQL